VIVEERHLLRNRLHRDPTEGPALIKRDRNSAMVVLEWYAVRGERHRVGGPAIVRRDPTSGVVCVEAYCERGRVHRLDGPAERRWHIETGELLGESYWRRGRLHRDPAEGPAVTRYRPGTRSPTDEKYFVNGKLQRPNGPALVERDPVTSVITVEEYYDRGRLHRMNDWPARIRRNHLTGVVEIEAYFRNGVCGRTPSRHHQPAFVQRDGSTGEFVKREYWRDGTICQEGYYEDGVAHRPMVEGPARIFRAANGEVTGEEYWEYGVQIEPKRKPRSATQGCVKRPAPQ
jgi:hypothetical protein